MDYVKFKHTKQSAVDNAAWSRFTFWAFSKEQFAEGIAKLGIHKDRKGRYPLLSIGAGGYIHVRGWPTWRAFWDNWEKYEKKIKNDEKFIIDGLVYEYGNHEAHLGFGGRESAEEYFPTATERQKKIAWSKFWKQCLKNDWF